MMCYQGLLLEETTFMTYHIPHDVCCDVGEKEEEKDGAIYVEYSRDH